MRIDAHQHFWRYDPVEYGWIDDSMTALRRDFLPAHLAPELASVGFQGSVAVQARQTMEETRWLLELAEASSFVLGVVGWVDLRSDRVRAQLGELAGHPKRVGVRHIVQSEPDDDFLLGAEFGRGIAQLRELDLAYDVLIYPRHLAAAAEFARRFPDHRLVLDHAAKPDVRSGEIDAWRRGLDVLAERPNVLCKLSGLVTEADWSAWTEAQLEPYIAAVLGAFGAERVMIGSDWPVCTLASGYERTMRLVIDYLEARCAPDRERILGENAARFWGLNPRRAAHDGTQPWR
jgi:L-fuconolactonase